MNNDIEWETVIGEEYTSAKASNGQIRIAASGWCQRPFLKSVLHGDAKI
jgi:hypothetical protein